MRPQTLDNRTRASDAVGIALSLDKLRRIRPDLFGWRYVISQALAYAFFEFPQRLVIREHLSHGDSRAAIVMSTSPLLVAAYTDELDCIVMLRFDESLAAENNLKPGSKLLTVNTYTAARARIARDLHAGPLNTKRHINFHPMIAEFLSDDIARINARKSKIRSTEWERTLKLAKEYMYAHPETARDGRPIYSQRPVKLTKRR